MARLDEQVYPRCELVAVFVNYPLVDFVGELVVWHRDGAQDQPPELGGPAFG